MTARRPLTVALVGPFPPPFGGMGVYFSSIEAGLRQAGLKPLRVPVPYAAVGGWRRHLGRVAVFARAAVAILRARPEVVHCVTGSQPNLIGNVLPLVAAQVVRRPSILSIAGGEFPAAVASYRGARRRLVRFILTRPQLLVACTDEIAAALLEVGVRESRITTVSNALPVRLDPRAEQVLPTDVEDFADRHAPLVASISGWYDYYGSGDLLKAVRQLRLSHHRLGLVLMVKGGGNSDFRAELLDLLAHDDLRDAVLVREDERAVFPILRRADVFVRTPHHEGDAISVREALAVGTPVVASDVGFRPGGVVRYRAADPVDLADSLRDALAGHSVGGGVDPGEGERNLDLLLATYRRLAGHPDGARPSRLAWYAGRAARMSGREIIWRAARVGRTLTGRDGLRERSDARILTGSADWDALLRSFVAADTRPLLLDRDRAQRIAMRRPAEVGQLIAEANRILAGEHAYLGYPTVNLGPTVDWNFDPLTCYRWPTTSASRLDHRVAGSDPKWIWELNRLQHLPVLAQTWLVTGDDRYAERAFEHLDSWLDQNPVGSGMAWRGAFEVGIRAISVAVALQGLRTSPALTAQRYRRAVRMLDASARHCWHGRSRFSSANNHLIGELAGMITVHLLFPELASPAGVYQEALDALADEAGRQILPDGSGAEQSVSYQVFTAELFAWVVGLLRLGDREPPTELVAALHRSARYLASVVGSEDPDPRYGDDDDGFAMRLGAEPKRTVRQHLGIVAATTAHDAAGRYGEMTLTATWFATALGTPVDQIGADVGGAETTAGAYAPNGGLVVLRPGPHRLTMDVGPLGYGSTAAHGHADALAVTLSAAGRELVVDPGTGSYYANPRWRVAHRGTAAHPTVCVDGLDQSEIGGPFYWKRHASTTIRSVDLTRGIVDAEHDGYRRLDDPVTHRRWLIAPPGDPTIVVVDLLDGSSEHDVTVSWPLHPELDWIPVADGYLVDRGEGPVLQLCHAATTPVELGQLRADAESGLGWWSDRLEARTPAWLLTATARGALPLAMLSLLRTADAGAVARPEIVRVGDCLEMSWLEHAVRRHLTIDPSAAGAVTNTPSSAMRLVSER